MVDQQGVGYSVSVPWALEHRMEWVLLMTLALAGPPGEVRDVAPLAVPDFSSLAACNVAGQRLAERMIALAGKTRMQQGIVANGPQSMPLIQFECVPVSR